MAVVINGNGAVTGLTALPDSAMATGSVVQTVYTQSNTGVQTSGTSYVDSGMTATITPSSSSNKILILASFNVQLFREATEMGAKIQLVRGSTAISSRPQELHAEADTTGQSRIVFRYISSINFQDSPSTTSATTYKIQFATTHTGNNAQVNITKDGESPGCLTLLEIQT